MTILAGLIEIMTVRRTELIGDDANIVSVISDSSDQASEDPVDAGTTEGEPSEWWQHYGFASRPPKKAQYSTIRLGDSLIAFASRVLEAAKVFGQLGEGDVAIYSIGGNTIRLAASGAVTVMMKGPAGKSIFARLSPKNGGEFHFMNEIGQKVHLTKADGLAIDAADSDVTIKCKDFQVLAQTANFNVAVLKSSATASKPFAGGGADPPSPGLVV